jgi:hypothetical protein
VTDCYQQQLKNRDRQEKKREETGMKIKETTREETGMKIKETTREDMTAEGRKQKRREETGRPHSRPDPAGSAPRAKRRRFFEASGENYPPLLLVGRGFYYFTSFARMSKLKATCPSLQKSWIRFI